MKRLIFALLFALSSWAVEVNIVTDNFDGGTTTWSENPTNSIWAWGAPSGAGNPGVHSATKVWGTNLSGNYTANKNDWVYSVRYNLAAETSYTKLYLEFWHYYKTELNYDGGAVYVSTDMATFNYEGAYNAPYNNSAVSAFGSIPAFSGNSGGWVKSTIDLSTYMGQDTVSVAFIFKSDNTGNDLGWYVDDFRIYGVNPAPEITGLSAIDSITATMLTDGSGRVKLEYEVFDSNDVNVTVRGKHNNGSWTDFTNAYTSGDSGLVGAGNAVTDRTFYWNALSELGNAVEANKLLRLVATDAVSGDTLQKTVYVDTKSPTAFTGFGLTNAGEDTLVVNWNACTEANFGHYELWYGTVQADVQNRNGGALEWDNGDDAALSTRTTATTVLRGLVPGTTFYVKAWAVDQYGNEISQADQSIVTQSTIAPVVTGWDPYILPVPVQFHADSIRIPFEVSDSDNSSVTILVEYKPASGGSWTNLATNMVGDTGSVSTSATTDRKVHWNVLSGLGALDDYYLARVIGDDGNMKDTATSASFLIDTRAPQNFTGFAKSSHTSTSATFSWSAPTGENGFNHYEIWFGQNQTDVLNRNGSAVEWDNADDAALATLSTAATAVTGLSSNQTYYFKIWAVDGQGRESAQGPVTAFTGISAVSSLPWSDNVENSFSEWSPEASGWERKATGAGNYSSSIYAWNLRSPSSNVGDTTLVSQPWTLTGYDEVTLSWWHKYDIEASAPSYYYDGGIIELDSGSNTWLQLTSARGYNGTVDNTYSNPIGGKSAWSGAFSGGRDSITINATYLDKDTLKIRFRFGSDNTGASSYWYLDDFYMRGTLKVPPVITGLNASSEPSVSQRSGVDKDSADIYYEVSDAYQTTVTITGQYRQGAGAWTALTNTAGDIGTVASTSAGADRRIRWKAQSQLGNNEGSNYQVRVIAFDGTYYDTATSASFTYDRQVPASLAGLASSGSTATAVTLTWTAASDLTFEHYEVWYGTVQSEVQNRNGNALEWDNDDDAALATAGTGTTTVAGLVASTTLYFKIWAVDARGNETTIADISAATAATNNPVVTGWDPAIAPQLVQLDLDTLLVRYEMSDANDATAYMTFKYRLGTGAWQVPTNFKGDSGAVAVSATVDRTIRWKASVNMAAVDTTIRVQVTGVGGASDTGTGVSADFSIDTRSPVGLATFDYSGITTTSVTLTWGPASAETHFSKYEIWYGTNLTNVQNRSGATKWDNANDAALATMTTAVTTITGLTTNTLYYFKIWAKDTYGRESTVTHTSATPAFSLPWTDNVESGVNGWTASASWVRRNVQTSSPTNSWNLGNGAYGINLDQSLVSPSLDTRGYSSIAFSFWHNHAFEAGAYDGGIVSVDTNGSNTWIQVTPNRGYPGVIDGTGAMPLDTKNGFVNSFVGRDTFSLSGALSNHANTRFQFRFASDGTVGAAGWNVDDIRLEGNNNAPVITGLSAADSFTVTHATPSDTAELKYEVSDGEGGTVTVSGFYKLGAGTWNAISSVTGDVGSVSATNSATDRKVKWVVKTDLGAVDTLVSMYLLARDITKKDTVYAYSGYRADTRPAFLSSGPALTLAPLAGMDSLIIDAAFTESNPDSNWYGWKINNASYTDSLSTLNTANPPAMTKRGLAAFNGDDTIRVRARHKDDDRYDTTFTGATLYFVKPYTPPAPSLASPTVTTVQVTVSEHGSEASGLSYAIYETTMAKYVQADGSLNITAVWQMAATWGAKTVTGLSEPVSTYSFKTKSRHKFNAATESDLSNAASAPMVAPELFDTLAATSTIQAAERADGSDTVDLYYQLRDADNGSDTVTVQYRNGVSGSWSLVTNTAGDAGVVTASDSSVHRRVRWHAAGQLGAAFESDSIQLRVVAKDGQGLYDTLTMAAANLLVDTKAPVISATAPAASSAPTTTQVSYTLSEAAVSGSVTWTRTGGTADPGSPHVQALAGAELNSGAHSNIILANNPSLVDAAIYTVAFNVADAKGHAALTVSNTSVTYDLSTVAPTLARPASNSADNATLSINFTLGEAALSGSVKMTFTRTGGSADANAPHAITFGSSFETAAQHTATLVGGDLSNHASVASVSSNPNDALVGGAVYSVKIEYQDAFGSPAAFVTNTGFVYDITPPVNELTLTATALSDTSIEVSWNPGAITDGSVDSVAVFWRLGSYPVPGSDEKYMHGLDTLPLTSTKDTLSKLIPGVTYYFAAVERDTLGQWSGTIASARATVATPSNITTPAPDSFWTYLKTAQGLIHDNVFKMYVDRHQVVWVGTQNGVSRYNGVFRNYTTTDGLANNNVRGIAQDKDGAIWFATYGGGTNRYDGKWRTWTTADGLANNTLEEVAVDSSNNLWFATLSSGVSKFDHTAWTTYNTGSGLPNNSTTSLLIEPSGTVWVGTTGATGKYTGAWSSDAFTGVKGIARDTAGNIWLGGSGGVKKVGGATYTTASGLPSNDVRDLTVSRSGDLWAGTFTGGLSRFNGTTWNTWDTLDFGPSYNRILGLTSDSSGEVWIGTGGRGVTRLAYGDVSVNASPVTSSASSLDYVLTLNQPFGVAESIRVWWSDTGYVTNVSVARNAAFDVTNSSGTKTAGGLLPFKNYYLTAALVDSVGKKLKPLVYLSDTARTSAPPELFDTLNATTTLQFAQRTNGSDTVDVYYQVRDADHSADTVSIEYRNGVSGSWLLVTNMKGDTGVVSATDSSVHRRVRWHTAGQLGTSFESDSIQLRVIAKDAGGIADTLTRAAADLVVDTRTPVISATAPTSPSTVNHTQVSYTLSEAASAGTVTWTRSSGTADGGSPHAQALAGAERNAGAHASITLANNPTLVNGSVYTISFNATDVFGHAATQVSNTAITYDVGTLTPTLAKPAAGAKEDQSIAYDFTLPEAASAGTVKLTFTENGSSLDANDPHVVTFGAALEGSGNHTGTLNGADLSSSANVSALGSAPNDLLVFGAAYDVKIEYQDALGNSAASSTSAGLAYLPGVRNWTGTANNNWTNALNWSPEGVPSNTDSVTFGAQGLADCDLDDHDTVRTVKFTGGFTRDFNFSDKKLTLFGSGDFSTGGTITIGGSSSTIEFSPLSGTALFTPKAGLSYPDIDKSEAGTLLFAPGNFTFDDLYLFGGTLDLGDNGDTISISGTVNTSSGATLDFGSSRLRVGASADFNALDTLLSATGILEFNGSGTQDLTPPAAAMLPVVEHSAASALRLNANPLYAGGFSQSAGTFNLNGQNLTLSGNLTLSNGTSTTLSSLGGRTLTVAGNASLSGQSGNRLNLNPGSAWTLTASGALTADWATLANATAGGVQGSAAHSVKGAGNVNWVFNTPELFDTTGATATIQSVQRTDGSDTVDVYYQLRDIDYAGDTVFVEYRNGVSGSWLLVVNMAGDAGTVSAADSSIHRRVRWHAAGQLGTSFESDSVQLRIIAKNNGGLSDTLTRAAANLVIDTKAPVISATAPAASSVVGNAVVSYTLSEAVLSGSVTWTRTGGAADGGSPHAQALTGAELGAGAHNGITLTNNPTLVDAGVYTIAFNAADPFGHIASTVSNLSVTFDGSAPTVATPVFFAVNPPLAGTQITLDVAFTEANPNTNTFHFDLNGGGYDAGTAGDANAANPAAQAITVPAVNGDDYFSAVKAVHVDDVGLSATSENLTDVYVRPYTPPALTVSSPTATSVQVAINEHASEAAGLEYVISETTTGKFVQADGTLNTGGVWQSAATWGSVTVAGLTSPVSQYSFKTKSRNSVDDATDGDYSAGASIVNTAPVAGYTADNVFPAAQIVQATDASGLVTLTFKAKDAQLDLVTLASFEYSDDGGSNWYAPANGDGSASLAGNWPDNGGGKFSSAADFSGADHAFTFNTRHADVTASHTLSSANVSNFRVRFKLNDGTVASAFGVSANQVLDNLAPVAATAVNFTSAPVAGSSISLDAAFTESNPGSNVYYYDLNGGGYDAGTAGDANTADPAAKAISVAINGGDYFSAVKAAHIDDYGNSFVTEDLADIHVKPYTPPAPTAANPTASTVDVAVNVHASEAAGLNYAIFETLTGNYVQANGSLGASAVWQSVAAWGAKTVTGLSAPVAQYGFKAKSRNSVDDATESDLSPAAGAANSAPAAGYTAANAIPAAQVSQATDGSGLMTITFRVKDNDLDAVSLEAFEYSDDGGSNWYAPVSGDGSAALGAGWPDNGGGGFSSAADFTGSTHTFTFNTRHANVVSTHTLANADVSNFRVRFKANDGSALSSLVLTANQVLDNQSPSSAVAIHYTAPPQAGSSIGVGAQFTETHPNTNTFYYDLNGLGYDTGTAAASNTATPGDQTLTVPAIDGADYVSAIKAVHVDDFGNSFTSEYLTDLFIKPYTPPAPLVGNPTASTVEVVVNEHASEAVSLAYAIRLTPAVGGNNWVQANGSVGAAEVWQSAAVWGTKTVTGLSAPVSQYQFSVKSRNSADNATESDLSGAATSGNTAPIVGYSADNVIPAAQVVQAADGSGFITVTFKAKDADLNSVALESFEYSDNGGANWYAAVSGDGSGALAGGWPDKGGGGFASAVDFSGAVHSFTFNTRHADVAASHSLAAADINNFRFRFKLNDGTLASVYGLSDNQILDNAVPSATIPVAFVSAPVAGSSIALDVAFSETHPNTNSYFYDLNGGGYDAGSAGDGNTADPAAKAISVTLDGDDYFSAIKAVHVDDLGNQFTSENLTDVFVKPYTPPSLTVAAPTTSTADVSINEHPSEAAGLSYAIFEGSTGQYVQANGSLGASAVWQTTAAWGTKTVTGLSSPVSQYAFQAKSRNSVDNATESDLSAPVSAAQVAPQLFDTLGAATTLQASQRIDGGDTVDVYYQLTDADNTSDTVVVQYRNGLSGSWSLVTGSTGDGGAVAASDSSIHRRVRWHAAGQLGTNFESDSLQLRIIAFDAENNGDTLTRAGADLRIDTRTPANVTALTGSALSGTQVRLTWSASTAADAESVRVVYKTSGYPADQSDGTVFSSLAPAVLSDTLTGLAEKQVYYAGLFVKDGAGHWSPAAAGAEASVTTPDLTLPSNVTGFIATAISGSQVSAAWTASGAADAESLRIVYKTTGYPADQTDGSIFANHVASITADTLTGLSEKTLYYVGLFVKDSAGNWSSSAAGARDTAKTPDLTAPANVTGLSANALAYDKIAIAWTAPASSDAESLVVRYRTDGSYPTDQNNGTLWRRSNASALVDTLTGLAEKTPYRIGVFVKDSAGNWSTAGAGAQATVTTPDGTAPANVTGLVATSISGSAVRLTWTGSASTDAESLRIVYKTSGYPAGQNDGTIFANLTASSSSDTLTGLTEKTLYYIGLFVKDSAGNWSATSSVARDTAKTPDLTAPANVTGLSASAVAADRIALGWTASASADAESLVVRYRTDGSYPTDQNNGTLWRRGSASATTDTLTGLVEKTPYRIGIFVRDSAGNWSSAGAGAQATATTPDGAIPANVTGFVATAISGTQASLTWTASVSPDAESLRIVYKTTGYPVDQNDGTVFANLTATLSADTLTGLAEKTLYYAGLFVKDSAGNWSAASSASRDTAKTPDLTAPANVTGLSASAVAPDRIALGWTASVSADAESLVVRYRTDGSYPTDQNNGTLWRRGTASTIVDTLTGLVEKTPYRVGIFVRDSAGNWSVAGAGAQAAATTPDGAIPANVTGFVATALSGSSVRLAWTSSSAPDAESLRVVYKTSGYPANQNDGTVFANLTASLNSDTLTGLAEKTLFYAALFVKDSAGNWSGATAGARDTAKTPDLTAPANVIGLSAAAIAADRIALGWTPSVSADAESLIVRYRTDGVYPTDQNNGTLWRRGTASTIVDTLTGLVEKTQYTIGLFVRDSAGNWSAAGAGARAAATTPDGTIPANVTGFVATAISGSALRLTWTPSTAADAESLRVVYNIAGYPADQNDGTVFAALSNASTGDTLTGLTEKTLYYAAVFVHDSAGLWSAASAGARDTAKIPDLTVPANVTGLSASAISPDRIALSWIPSASADAESVRVVYKTTGYPANRNDGTIHATLDANDTLTGLTEKTRYYMGLFVRDSAGNWSASSAGAQASATTPDGTAPANVTGFAATAISGTRIALAWTPSASSDAESVQVVYNTTGYPADQNDGTVLVTGDTITGVNEKTLYYVAAFVRDSAGNWSIATSSARDTAKTPDLTRPQAASAVQAIALSGARIAVSWALSPDSDIELIRVVVKTGGFPADQNDGTLFDTLPASATADTLTGFDDKSLYYVGVFVRDSAGLWCLADTGSRDSVTTPDTTRPLNVTGVTGGALSSNTLWLSWTPSASSDAESLRVVYKLLGYPLNVADGAVLAPQPLSSTADTATGLTEDTTYYFSLFIRDSAGLWSSTDSGAQVMIRTLSHQPVRIVISPSTAMVTSDSGVAFSAVLYDPQDSVVTVPRDSLTWTLLGNIGAIDSLGRMDAGRVGVGFVRVSYAGISDTTDTIQVLHGVPTRIVISPRNGVLAADSTLRFTLAALDVHNNQFLPTGIQWSLYSGPGAVDSTGLFTPVTPDSVWITATVGPLNDLAGPFLVIPGSLDSFVLLPAGDTTLMDGDTLRYVASGYDAKGNPLTLPSITYAVTDSVKGVVDGTGLFTAMEKGALRLIALSSGKADTSGLITVQGSATQPGDTNTVTDSGVTVVIPPGALDSSIVVTIETQDSLADSLEGFSGFSDPFLIEPVNVTFDTLVEIRLPLNDSTLTPAEAAALRLFVFDLQDSTWKVVYGSHFDTATGTVLGGVSEFGIFQAGIDTVPALIADSTLRAVSVDSTVTIDLGIDDNVSNVLVTVHYRKTGESDFHDTTFMATGDSAVLSLDSIFNTPRGIEYYVEVDDGTQKTVKVKTSIAAVVDNLTDERTFLPLKYRMFSIPLQTDNDSVSSVLKELGTLNPDLWKLYTWQDSAYVAYDGANLSAIETGRAYWLKVKSDSFQLKTGSGRSVTSDTVFKLTLVPGWNMIGSPYYFSIDLHLIREQILLSGHASDLYGPYTYAIDGGGQGTWKRPYFSPGDSSTKFKTLDAWQGYMIKNESSDTLTLEIPAVEYDSVLSAKRFSKAKALYQTDWEIGVRASSDRWRSDPIYAGTHASAAEELDGLDLPKPPAIEEELAVDFPRRWIRGRGRYVADVRPPITQGRIWEFEIRGPVRGKEVAVTFNFNAEALKLWEVYLYDARRKFAVNLKEASGYTYLDDSTGTRQLTLLVGTPEYVTALTGGRLGAPTVFHLGQNYPNPFNPVTQIHYQLSQKGRVDLEIFDTRGRLVRTLVSGTREAGYYQTRWDGRTNGGGKAATGIYFYKIKVERKNIRVVLYRKTRQMVFVK